MKRLETKRLILRSWTLDDLGDFYEYAKNPNVGPNAGWKEHETKEDSMAILKQFIEHDNVWAIELKDSGKIVGSIGLHEDSKRENDNTRMIGYVLSEECWGKGFMTEGVEEVIKYVFEELGLSLLSVYHYSGNKKSQRVIEKCGFKYEGKLRCGKELFDGNILDELCYSLTRDEYLKKKEYSQKIFN